MLNIITIIQQYFLRSQQQLAWRINAFFGQFQLILTWWNFARCDHLIQCLGEMCQVMGTGY
ncbi:MAG: hypothetical protein V7K67_01340 [Nostoc sp.]|uniref:hypothetical protein n=1 Tax=Nostoc sp. TaxID=1180 RepID=UPI002FFBA6A2